MATISEQLARQLVRSKGVYADDPLPYAVLEFKNRFNGETNFAVAYREEDFHQIISEVDEPKVLWRIDG